jgi:RNA polymerase sigma-70 factor (ECF subfamily)
MVTAVTGDRHEAHDIAQEAFARALARWPRVSGYELPEAWVRQVAMRLAADSVRRIRRTLRAVPLLRAADQPKAPEPGDRLAFTALGQALARIPLRNARCSSCTTSPICRSNRSITTGASRSAP